MLLGEMQLDDSAKMTGSMADTICVFPCNFNIAFIR